jgi:SAM-dependent methyltransferase
VTALEEQLRAGAVDLCGLVLDPDGFPEWRAAIDSTPLEALLKSDPEIGERNAARVIRTGQIRADDTLADLDIEQRSWLAEMILFWRRQLLEPSSEVSPNDQMYRGGSLERYFTTGHVTVRRIKIAMLEAQLRDLTSILDFGCAWGRVMRSLKVAFPNATLTACDTNREAVDFCVEAFGAIPVYSTADSKAVDFGGPFDLIWAGSVFSHMNAARWRDFLGTFGSLLSPGGLLVFTTPGRRSASLLRAGKLDWGLGEGGHAKLLSDYDEQGFGYADFPEHERGVTLVKPWWTCAELEHHHDLRLLSLREYAWGEQDVVACMRADAADLGKMG